MTTCFSYYCILRIFFPVKFVSSSNGPLLVYDGFFVNDYLDPVHQLIFAAHSDLLFLEGVLFFSFYMFSERKFFLCEQSKREVRLCVHVWLFIFVRLRLACRCSLVSSDGVLLQYYNPLMLATLLEPISIIVHSGDIQEC